MAVKFKSLDKQNRTATFDVDGKSVTRRVPAKFEGTIDDYLIALAKGLQVEADNAKVQDIEAPTVKAGEVLAERVEADERAELGA